MQQRRPRLGDVIDDYCPRERRITNHAVVAMIEDTVKQTRCSTCDAEHEYKQGKTPATRRRKTAAPGAAQLVEGAVRPPETADVPEEVAELEEAPAITDDAETAEQPSLAASAEPAEQAVASEAVTETEVELPDEERESENWPVHRPLIRATLPRPEGQVPERKAPDFTMRQGGKFDPNRNGRHRGGGGGPYRQGGRQAQGTSQFGQGSSRFGGQRGPGQGQGGGPSGQRHGGGNRPPGQGGGGNRPGQGQGPGRGPRPGGGGGRKRGR